MIIKNRKLVRRDNLGKIADYIDLDRLKTDAEVMMLEVPDDAWFGDENERNQVADLFDWNNNPHGEQFWQVVAVCFTVAPLPTDTVRLAEIDDEIARLKGEREKLMQGGTR